MITFLNLALVGGVAAASLPFLIYLFNRSRFRVQPWAAMHLLRPKRAVNRRRVQLEHLLLLLLRAAIIALLALCMAQPVLTGMRALLGHTQTSLVVLLDNSFSMAAGDDQRPNFARAQEETAQVLDQLPSGSQAALLGLAGPVSEHENASYEVAGAAKQLPGATGGYGVANIADGLERAATVFAGSMHHPDRQLLLVSDFQRTSWDASQGAARARALSLLKAGPVTPELLLLDVGAGQTDNLAVETVELTPAVVGVNQTVTIRGNLVNHGGASYPNLRALLVVDGQQVGTTQVSLMPGQHAQVLFTYIFPARGSHLVEVRLDASRLIAGNTCRRSVPVLDTLPVLLVDGHPSPLPLQQATAYLEIALKPFGAAGGQLKDLITTTTVGAREFKADHLRQARIVVLADVPTLRDEQLLALQEFVSEGGGLLVFTGSHVDQAWYNQKLYGDGTGLLPMRLLALATRPPAPAGSAPGKGPAPATLVSQHFSHPALELFNDPKNGGLDGAEITTWFAFGQPAANAARGSPAQVLAALDSGDPLLVEKGYGAGHVMLCATSADTDWSNLPLRTFFLPLTQQVVTYLAATVYPPRNLAVGQPLSAVLPPDAAGRAAVLTDPAGLRHQVPVLAHGLHSIAEYRQTQLPGVYLFASPGGETTHYVVSIPPEELNLDRLTSAEIAEVTKELGATLLASAKEYRAHERTRHFGQGLWLPCLALALAACFAELWLGLHFARRRP